MKAPWSIWFFSIFLMAFECPTANATPADCPEHAQIQLEKKHPAFCYFSGSLSLPDPIDPTRTREVPFHYYFSRASKKNAPLVLVYPSLSDELPIVEDLLSKKLNRHGLHAIVVDLVEDIADLSRAPATINDFFIRSNWSSRELINLASQWSEVDSKAIHALGVSLGGIRASMAFADDLRLRRLVTYVAGGNLPEIFARSKVKLVQNYREHWKKELGLNTDAEFGDYLKTVLSVDPLISAKQRPARLDVYLIMGGKDVKVPFKNQLELFEAYQRPKHRISHYGHRITGASFLTKFPEVTDFLR